jgi:hypothetical protein
MNKFTQQDCITIGHEIEKALKQYSDNKEISIFARGGVFSEQSIKLSLEIFIGKDIPRPSVLPPISPSIIK